jgi:CDP-diacylglycerol--glycerol-3-phosphate 3-phosphatidyltransferase/cardiolipin synthase
MLSLPNLMTLSRILAVPLLVILIWPKPDAPSGPGESFVLDYMLAWLLYCLMGITDYFDGYLARRRGLISKLGQFLDPIADKIVIAAIILLLVFTRDIDGIHVIAALIILLREIIVSGLREFLADLRVQVPVSQLAKWKTTAQLFAFGGFLLAGALPQQEWIHIGSLILLWLAALVTLVTGYDYLRAGLRHMD